MTTLYNKLTQENKSKLAAASIEYPLTISNLIDCLVLTYSWTDLRVGDAQGLIIHLTNEVFSIDSLAALFAE